MNTRRAIVLLSGGLDSATVLAIARAAGFECHALSLDYGQRHSAELAAAARVAASLGAAEHRVMRLGLGELATLFWHLVKDRPEALTRETIGEALVAQGLAAVTPALRVLIGQILQGR